MQKILTLFLLFSVFYNLPAQQYWQKIDNNEIIRMRNLTEEVIPEKFASFSLDITQMQNYLLAAPDEFNATDDYILLEIPMPNGLTEAFRVSYSPVMEEGLAKKYPGIRSYKGFGLRNKKHNVRFDISEKGFRASIQGENSIYIDPVSINDKYNYLVYYTKDYKEDISNYNLTCGMMPEDILAEDLKEDDPLDPMVLPGEEIQLRSSSDCDSVQLYTYRLALACTGEWGSAHGNTVESALADMVTSVNRINQIYENEFAIRMILVNDNDKLIWLDKETDPYPIGNVGFELLSRNTIILNNNIGPDAYDIGHVFTRSCTDVGGVASLGSVCSTNNRKGSAVTCHYSNNLNYIITNVTAHEMGHQFSAQHTFNNCNGNESAGSDYEPGGGTTIMAYCGLCGSNNVNYSCLDNFHALSVEQVGNFTRIGGGSLCATILSTGNSAPKVELKYTDGFSIPVNTPFMLEGEAFDCEGDEMSYSWEEWDLGPQIQIGDPLEDSPIFTAHEPKDVPYRIFPEMYKIVNNVQNNAEILPAYTRPLNFRFIARDNNENGGGTGWKNVSFNADISAGPFEITYPNQIGKFKVGEEIEIQWDVANTDNNIINCQFVNIWLATDGGYTYDKLLSYNTPNDGVEKIIFPNNISTLVRIKIEAADNIFFDISDNYIRIEEPDSSTYFIDATPKYQKICLPDVTMIEIESASFNNYSDTISFEISGGLPEGAIATFSPAKVFPGDNSILELDLTGVNIRDRYKLEIMGVSDGGDTLKRIIELDLITNDYSDLEIIQPLSGESGQGQLVDLIWSQSQSADSYNVFLSKNPSFPANETMMLLNTQDTIFTPSNTLEKSTLYYWKVQGINECGNRDASEIITFSTEAFSCRTFASEDVPLDIRSYQTTKSVINITEETSIADINIITIKGDHDNFYDLDAKLVAPDSTSVDLFSAKCYNNGALLYDFGMDDESTSKFRCPPYIGSYYPSGSLSDLIGTQAKGEWTLEIYDRQSPKGGELAAFELEICANSVLNNPYIVNNNSYKVAIGIPWDLPSENLRAEDDDNLPEELNYTLVTLPVSTSILKDGASLGVGDQFTEADIRNGVIQLMTNGEHGFMDSFLFTITDGNGGWVDKTSFSFVLDEQVEVNEVLLEKQFRVYPNPVSELVNIHVTETGEYQLEIFDLNGKKLWGGVLNGFEKKQINLGNFPGGVYYLRLRSAKTTVLRKIVKQ